MNYIDDFLSKYHLDQEYLTNMSIAVLPLLQNIVSKKQKSNNTLFIGINGCQGSGKSTLADYLALKLIHEYHLSTISCSLDDFYLDTKQREHLATSIHPLLRTRGVPGTHNIDLLTATIDKFHQKKSNWRLPIFNKSTDNPYPKDQWLAIEQVYDVVIIEGWCWGTPAQSANELHVDINKLEEKQDPNHLWRNYVNQQIIENYQPLYQKMDVWLMLQAPSFDVVYQWRLEQEDKLRLKTNTTANDKIMSATEIEHFIQYFQRLTEHSLKYLPNKVNFLYTLNKNRKIT